MSVPCVLSALPVAGSVCLAGPRDLVLPGLPDAAGDVAKDVLDQLGAGIVPPVPGVHELALASGPGSMTSVPEPAALALLALTRRPKR